jgi:predicted nucleic acid-binding protein
MKITNQYILLDSCIVSYLLSKTEGLAQKTDEFLIELKESDNLLYISELTHYEIMRDIDDNKKEKARKILSQFGTIEVDKKRLERAASLYEKYKNNESIKPLLKSGIDDIDIMLGALICVSKKPLLLTANYSDFPRPFFKENHIERIEYKFNKGKNKDKKASLYYYFFEANIEKFKE